MADNIAIETSTGPAASPVATDEIGGVHYQVVKVAHGAPDTATPVSTADPLPTVDAALAAALATLNAAAAAIQAATQTLAGRTLDTSDVYGTVSVSNLPATQPISADALPLPSGAATQATLAQIAAAVGQIDAPAGTAGLAMLARYQANDAAPADADGDWCGLSINEVGRLRVSAQPALGDLTVGDITASGKSVVCQTERWSNVMVHMVATGLSGHVCVFEGSLDSTDGTDGNWFGIQACRSNANTIETSSPTLAATPAYGWELSTNGLRYIRVRATAHTGGTATWKFLPAPYATEPIPAAQTHTVTLTCSTSYGAALGHRLVSAAGTNATSVKTSAASINVLTLSNASAYWRWLKLYNKNSAPTVGTDTPLQVIGIPPGQTLSVACGQGLRHTSGLAYAITANPADNDATAIGAGDVVLSINYT